MSILDTIQGATRHVVTFPGSGLRFEVRPVTSADLAHHQVCGLMAAAGKRQDPERDKLTAELLKQQALIKGYAAGDVPAEVAAKASTTLTQLRAYDALALGPDKARSQAELREGIAMAGVVRISNDGETWKACTISRDSETSEDEETVVLNLRDASKWVPGIASAVETASLKEANATLATFPGKPQPSAPA